MNVVIFVTCHKRRPQYLAVCACGRRHGPYRKVGLIQPDCPSCEQKAVAKDGPHATIAGYAPGNPVAARSGMGPTHPFAARTEAPKRPVSNLCAIVPATGFYEPDKVNHNKQPFPCLEYLRTFYTDLNSLWLLAEWH
jgi:hypothetical protein